MKRIIALTMALLCVLLLCACGSNGGAEGSADPAEAIQNEKTVTISTPYADLRVPESFDKAVSHEETGNDPYVLTFKSNADGTELFSFIFNGEGDNLFGTLMGKEANTVIHLRINELDETAENYEDNLFYQSQMNLILGYLTEDYEIATNEVVAYEDTENFDIETSVVTLKYPAKWKDKVQVDVQEDGVKFSADGTPLFDLMFKKCDGYLLGTYQDTPIYMVEHPVESEEHIAMQTGVNVILENLMQDPDFVINN